MKVFEIQIEYRGGSARVTARVEPKGGRAQDVWFRLDGLEQAPTSAAEALAVGLLTPCMFEGEDLKIYGALSWTLARNLEAAKDVLASWHPDLAPVDVLASQFTRVWRGVRRPSGTALCFTAGINSWYSLLKHEHRVTHLILVRGFDAELDDDDAWHDRRARVGRIADQFGKRLVTCETNLRSIADKQNCTWGRRANANFWGPYLHGSALAAVGLLLQREVGGLIVSAVHTYQRLKPWGSSPLLDPLWSTDRMQTTHEGCEASGMDKVRVVATSDLALETLHVCDRASVNCGRCEKCLRWQLALRVAGAPDSGRAFPVRLAMAEAHATLDALGVTDQVTDTIAIPHRIAAARYALRAALAESQGPASETLAYRFAPRPHD